MARKNNRPRRVNEILSGLAAVRPVACFAKVYHPVYGLPLELVEELESDWSVLEEFMDRAVMECAPSQRLKDPRGWNTPSCVPSPSKEVGRYTRPGRCGGSMWTPWG